MNSSDSKAQPRATGPSLPAWPQRVAIVPYGFRADYSPIPLLMTNKAAGQMPVASPADLQQWAGANSVQPLSCAVV